MYFTALYFEITFLFSFFLWNEAPFIRKPNVGNGQSRYNFIHLENQCGCSFLVSLHYSL